MFQHLCTFHEVLASVQQTITECRLYQDVPPAIIYQQSGLEGHPYQASFAFDPLCQFTVKSLGNQLDHDLSMLLGPTGLGAYLTSNPISLFQSLLCCCKCTQRSLCLCFVTRVMCLRIRGIFMCRRR